MAKQCARCHGGGSIPCNLCGGRGIYDRFPFDPADLSGKECDECDGSGKLTCPVCHGSGEIDGEDD